MADDLNNLFNSCSGFTVLALLTVLAILVIATLIRLLGGDRSKPI